MTAEGSPRAPAPGGGARSPRGSRGRGVAPYAIVAAVGILFAAGAAIGADHDPGVWIVPPLVLTGVLLTVLRVTDHRSADRAIERAGDEIGLRFAAGQTLPPVTPILVGAKPPRVTDVLRGPLAPGGPDVRIGRVAQRSGAPLLVALTDAHDGAARFADPHRVLALTDAQHDDEPIEPDVLDWLSEHPLRLALATGEGALVVAAPVDRHADPPWGELLEAAREAHARLAPKQQLW